MNTVINKKKNIFLKFLNCLILRSKILNIANKKNKIPVLNIVLCIKS